MLKIILITLLLFCTHNSFSQKMDTLQLSILLQEVKYISLSASRQTIYTDYTNKTILLALKAIGEGKNQELVQQVFLSSFADFETCGWHIEEKQLIYDYYERIAKYIGIKQPIVLINQFDKDLNINEILIKLDLIKNEKHFEEVEMSNAKEFYNIMRKTMNKSIDNIIKIIKLNPDKDKILVEFDRSLQEFEQLKTSTHQFGDTEDRYAVGELYERICDYLHIHSTRGVLRRYLD